MSINSPMLCFEDFIRIPRSAMDEAYGKTQFYTWRAVDRASTQRLQRFTQDLVGNGLIPTPAMYLDDIHMSIIRTENELPNYVPDKMPVRVIPVRWVVLGGHPNYYLCLITQIPDRIVHQIELAKKQKAKFVFENFLPHISVAQYHTKQIDFEGLPLPKFNITLEAEERHHFNEFM